jgi:cell wall-associated NlpC family hydrolase
MNARPSRQQFPRALRTLIALCAALSLLAAGVAGSAVAAPGDPTTPSQEEVRKAREDAERAAGGVAAAQRELVAASTQLQRLGTTLAVASERYNAAMFVLEQARDDAREARAQHEASVIAEAAAQDDLGAFAAAAYRSGGDIARVSAMLGADGPQTLIDQASTMTVLGDRQAAIITRLEAARAASAVLRQRAESALDEQQAAAAEVARAKATAERAVARQQAVADRLAERRESLIAQLQRLQGRSESLARARADALEREAAERAAAEAALDAGWIEGDVPRGILLGMPATVPVGSERGTAEGARAAVAFAKKQIGKPYVWGGAGPERFDCSGLTMRAWEQAGVQFSHWSVAQYAQARKIPLSQMRPGDLVFFSTDLAEYRAIVHVGLYIGDGQMIEAPYTGATIRVAPIQRASLFGAARP